MAIDIVTTTAGQIGLPQALLIADHQLEVQRARNVIIGEIQSLVDAAEGEQAPLIHARPDNAASAPGTSLSRLKQLDRYLRRAVSRRDRAVFS